MFYRLLKSFLKRYIAICDYLSKIGGHCFGPQIHYLWASISLALFAYGYITGMANQSHHDLFVVLICISLPVTVITHWFLHGFFTKIKIKSIFPSVNRVNAMYKGANLRQTLGYAEYDQLLKDLTKLPILRLTTSFLDASIFFIPAMGYEIYQRGFENIGIFIQAIIITIPNLMFFSYLTTDLHFTRSRARVRKKIYKMGRTPKSYYAFSLRRKFALILLLIAVSGYLLITLMSAQSQQPSKIINRDAVIYAIIAMINLTILIGLFIFNILNAVFTLEKMSQSLRVGKEPKIFSGTADKELARLSDGLFAAARRLLRNKRDLESKVAVRTQELVTTNNELLEQRRIADTELDIASEIQRNMLAYTAKTWNNLTFNALSVPMAKVTGDYYDIFRQKNFVYIVMADISGHGVPAALITIAAKLAFANSIKDSPTPAQVCRRVNKLILEQVSTPEYLTAFVMRVDDLNNALYCNAGHTRAILFHFQKTKIEALDTPGICLGAIDADDSIFEDREIQLKPNDRIFLFTDGVSECANPKKEQFTEARLIETISQYRHLKIEDLNNQILAVLKDFSQESFFHDDVSMLTAELQQNSMSNFGEL